MLDLLVKIDDVRAKSVLIEGMVASGSRVASGLLALGAVPEVIDSLGSHRAGMGWGAIMALMEMQKHRPERFGTKETDKIKGYLLRRVRADGGAKMAFIKGLGVFGDGSVISLLQQVAEQDTFSGPARKYVNRDCAERVLLEIRARKEN